MSEFHLIDGIILKIHWQSDLPPDSGTVVCHGSLFGLNMHYILCSFSCYKAWIWNINFCFTHRWASQPTHPPPPPPSVIVIIPTTLSSARQSSRTPPPPTSPPPPRPTASQSQPTPHQPTLPPLIPSLTSAARPTWTRPSTSQSTHRGRTRQRPSRTCTAHPWPRTRLVGRRDKEPQHMRIGSRYLVLACIVALLILIHCRRCWENTQSTQRVQTIPAQELHLWSVLHQLWFN